MTGSETQLQRSIQQRLELEIPMALPSRGNAKSGATRWDRHKLVKQQRKTMARALLVNGPHPAYRNGQLHAELDVLLIRIAPRPLDDDNLRQSLKHPRDSLALWLGLPNDRDPRVRWLYGQAVDEQRRPRYQALQVVIAPREDCPTCGASMLKGAR
jgi:hypothetical protein